MLLWGLANGVAVLTICLMGVVAFRLAGIAGDHCLADPPAVEHRPLAGRRRR